jgi:hypothetical protein
MHGKRCATRAGCQPADITRSPELVAGRDERQRNARLFLIASIFLVSGFAKLTDTPGTVAHMVAMKIPYPETLALVAGTAEVLGAIAIAAGFLTRVASAGLILYLIPTTLIFHGVLELRGSGADAADGELHEEPGHWADSRS